MASQILREFIVLLLLLVLQGLLFKRIQIQAWMRSELRYLVVVWAVLTLLPLLLKVIPILGLHLIATLLVSI